MTRFEIKKRAEIARAQGLQAEDAMDRLKIILHRYKRNIEAMEAAIEAVKKSGDTKVEDDMEDLIMDARIAGSCILDLFENKPEDILKGVV